MTKEQYEKDLELRWKEFWESIKVPHIDCEYWKSIFEEVFETGFNRGFAYANDEPYSDAVFEHRNLSQDSAYCDNHNVQDNEFVDHFAEARNMLRLKIAAQFAIVIMTGPGEHFNYYLPGSQFPSLIGRKIISEVNRVALLYADDLISQSMKGGAE